ncbi:uncharacterized protein N7473_001681 [Penicillium subrubescens]|uniref:uncharacterized protein n=1 Tax=Penicillium subrubescens TaxID=1316194 RepID=UPI002544EB92|nr:uncharacterized protein N7473_001681 [Penicillium subrubescens]KAJ5904765.1 hypothetical protein N7473_001681 [Penicillium subrubescens]
MMVPTQLFGSILVSWVLFHLSRALYNIFFHPLRHYPGPKLLAASQLLNVYHIVKGDGSKYTAELHEAYGDVVRVGPNELSFISPSANKTIYGGRPQEGEVFEKNPIANLQGTREIQNIFFAPSKPHARYKKLMAPAFSEMAIREQETMLQHYTTRLIQALRGERANAAGEASKENEISGYKGRQMYPDQQQIVDLSAWYNFIIFDVLSSLAFGQSVGCLDQGCWHPWVSSIFNAIINATFLEAAHRLWPYHLVFDWLITPRELKDDYASHLHYTQGALKNRNQEDSARKANFSSFIQKGMTEEELFDNANIVVTAGGETTAATLSATTYYLMHNRPSYEKLVKEIRERFQCEGDIKLSALGDLKYLRAVIKESLRIHPAIAIGLHRLTPAKGKFIDEHWVPGGTWVAVANLAACRNTRYWKNPDKFVPERWLGDPEYASDNLDAASPFSIGTRACIGINLANANMRLILARLLWNFDLEGQSDNVDPQLFKEHGIWKGTPLKTKLVDIRPKSSL